MNKQSIYDAVSTSKTLAEVCDKLGCHGSFTNIRRYIKKYHIDISHFTQVKRGKQERICPVCGEVFYAWECEKKKTCGHACANTYFRSGEDNGNHKRGLGKTGNSSYRYICFKFHEKRCIVCGEDHIVHAHHYDGDEENNDPKNLVPLCPTHHQYMHSRFKYLIEDKVKYYIENFIST